MMSPRHTESNLDQYIRQRVREARNEVNETQDDLAEALNKNRVTISDMERGRIAINASDLANIAAHYGKPISYFFPSRLTVSKESLSNLDQEILVLFWSLEEGQQYIAIENLRQQVELSRKALDRMFNDSMHENDEK